MFKNPFYSNNKKVIVLDMDHTIIGEGGILAQIDFYVENMRWLPGFKPQPITRAEIIGQFELGFLRPGFTEFIREVREKRGSLVVIYTAAQKSWADKILGALNEYLGYQFYCLLFSRQHCIPITLDKSLALVQDYLQKVDIIRKAEDFVMIDNNLVMQDSRLIMAPDYRWTPEINIYKRLNGNQLVRVSDKNHLLFTDIQFLNKGQFYKNMEELKDVFFRSLLDWID